MFLHLTRLICHEIANQQTFKMTKDDQWNLEGPYFLTGIAGSLDIALFYRHQRTLFHHMTNW